MDLFQNEKQAFEWLRRFDGFENLNEKELREALNAIMQFSEISIAVMKKQLWN